MGSLSNLYISQSYTSLVHLGNDGPITALAPGQFVQLQDGLGNDLEIQLNSNGDVNIGGILSASNIPTDIATQAELNAYTQSTNIRLNNIESTTASLNISVTNLNASSASQQVSINSINAVTASFLTSSTDISALNAFTASQIGFNNSATASISQLLSFSSSLDTNFVTESELAAATASLITQINTKLDTASFNAYTASQSTASIVTSISNLNSATQSLFNSASLGLVTASFSGQTLTFTKGNGTTFDIAIPDISGSTIDTGSLVTTASFNAYTQSNNQRVNSLEVNSASVNISITNVNSATASLFTSVNSLNTYTASQSTASIVNSINALNASSQSQQISIDALNVFTASQSTASIETSITNLNSFTQSANSRLNNLETTSASVNVSISNLNSTTSSLVTSVANLNSFTQSQLAVNVVLSGEIDSLQAATASYAISSSVAAVDAAQQTQINSLISATSSYITEAETASFARTNVNNNFTANQTFTNITAVSASFTYIQTLYETASVIYSSGSNQLGDSLDDIQTLSGSVLVRGSLRVNGIPVLTSSVNISGLVTTSSFNAYTSSNNERVSSLEVNSASVNISISALNTFTASQSTASLVTSITNLNTFSASTLVSIANINTTTASLNTSASLALVTASFDSGTRNLTFTKGNTTQFSVNIPDTSGSVLPNGVVSGSQQIIDLGFLQTSSFNSYTASQSTASLVTSIDNLNTFTQSANISINALNAATSSYVTSAITASSLITASFDNGTRNLTFTKGDTTTFAVNIPDVSGSTINTGSFATTGSNSFVGNQRITGSLSVTSSTEIGFIVLGGLITNPYLKIGDDNRNDITLNANDFNVNLNGGDVKINTNTANRGIQIEGPDPAIAFRDTTAPFNPYINITNTNQLLQITDSNSTIVTMNTASFNIPSASFTASLQQGYVWVGNSSGKTTTVATSSFVGTTIDTGSFVTTSSFNAYTASTDSSISQLNASSASQQVSIDALNTFTASQSTASLVTSIDNLNTFSASALVSISNLNSTTASLLVETQNLELFSASALISISNLNGKTGSYATTGSNVFTGSQTFADSGSNGMTLHSISGSLVYTNSNIDNFLNISGAFATANPNARLGGNLLFKTSPQQSGSLVISGSGNLVMNMPTVNPGFRAQLTAGNLVFAVPQISASMQNAVGINANTLQATVSMRGPVTGSGGYNINTNYIAANVFFGASAANHFERAITGVNLSNNIITSQIVATANSASLNTAFSIASSNINVPLTINAISSSVQIGNSTLSGLSATINNRASHSIAPGTNNFLILSSVLHSGQTTVINADGASATNVSPGLVASFLGGTSTTVQLGTPGVTTSSNQLRNSIVYGFGLFVTGSNSAAATFPQGSAFFGRLNSTTPNQNDSSYVVFAVGTGTNATTGRKTGFLIDSGSNTFVEGTLNVSGATSLNGTTNITGSLLVNGVAVSGVNTGSFATTGSNSFVGTQRITGSLIVSGAAGVEVRLPSFDVTNGRVRDSLSFTGSVDANTDMGILTPAQFAFNQNAIGDSLTGAQLVVETNKASGFTELKLNARYTGSSDAQLRLRNAAGVRTLTVDADVTSLDGLLITRGVNNNNTALGANVLQNSISGGNVAIGTDALFANTSGTDNVALGNSALTSNISGDRNMAIGSNTLDSNTTGTLNVAIGNATLAGLVDGNANVGIGFEALKNQTTGSYNVGIGSQVLNQNISGSGNIAFGAFAGYNETGSGNFYIGNGNYGSINADRSGSLMWGTMDTFNASNQTLKINASVTIQSGSSFYANGNKQFNVGAFSSLVTQSGSAGVSQSMNFDTTDKSEGVSIVSNSRITLANSGTYNIQFSAQVLADTGADDVYIWLKKNGTNVINTTTKLLLRNNEEAVAAWNFVVDAVSNDYFELVWESASGDAVLLYEVAAGNYPAIPSIILTVTQVR
jgi:uncharacterized coiled-coil protein SlyX